MFEIPVILLPPLGMLCKYIFTSTLITVQVEAIGSCKRRQKCFCWYNVIWISEINFIMFTAGLGGTFILLYQHQLCNTEGAYITTQHRSLYRQIAFSSENANSQCGYMCMQSRRTETSALTTAYVQRMPVLQPALYHESTRQPQCISVHRWFQLLCRDIIVVLLFF